MYRRRRLLTIFALVATLALPQGALAASSGTTTETLTVSPPAASYTLTNVPAAITYDPITVGDVSQHTESVISFQYSATVTSANVTVSGTDFTGPTPSIPASARGFTVTVTGTGTPANLPAMTLANHAYTILTIPSGGGSGTLNVTPLITLPASPTTGTYTGTLTWNIGP